jgi:adiponectin receptor
MFVGMGLSAVFPVLHGLSKYGMAQLEKTIGLSWVLLQGALYVVGAGLYAVSRFKLG